MVRTFSCYSTVAPLPSLNSSVRCCIESWGQVNTVLLFWCKRCRCVMQWELNFRDLRENTKAALGVRHMLHDPSFCPPFPLLSFLPLLSCYLLLSFLSCAELYPQSPVMSCLMTCAFPTLIASTCFMGLSRVLQTELHLWIVENAAGLIW